MARIALIADDSVTIRQMVSFTLRQAGFTVIEAVDGQDAADKLGDQRVDLVITDLNMPRMDGISFIRVVRTRAACKHTPVLMLTTESQQEKRQEARAAGATGWIVKPFDPDKLLQVVAKVVP